MSLTDHLHRKSDPIRAFLDERLVDFSPAKEQWHAAQLFGPLVKSANNWHLVAMAIDQRIRMMLETPRLVSSPKRPHDVLSTSIKSVMFELEKIQSRHSGPLGELEPNDEERLLQVCYVLAMYTAYSNNPIAAYRNSPLRTLKTGAGWKAHLNRVPQEDVEVLKILVKPAAELFPLFADMGVIIGPVFEDSRLVDGADGDLIVNHTLIEIKCETPGFSGGSVRQVITYALLDSSGKYELERCSIYLARYGSLASWKLNDLIRSVSQGQYGYHDLRQEFHSWLVAREELRVRKSAALAESERRFAAQWQAVSSARKEFLEARFDDDAQRIAATNAREALKELRRLETESGLDIHRE